jgi:hypothetical protein
MSLIGEEDSTGIVPGGLGEEDSTGIIWTAGNDKLDPDPPVPPPVN